LRNKSLIGFTGKNGARPHLNVDTNSGANTAQGSFWTSTLATEKTKDSWPNLYVEIGESSAKASNVGAYLSTQLSVICVRN
jgi:hypothetical protein